MTSTQWHLKKAKNNVMNNVSFKELHGRISIELFVSRTGSSWAVSPAIPGKCLFSCRSPTQSALETNNLKQIICTLCMQVPFI